MMVWIIATFAAFFIKGLCGFANTLVFTSILGFGVANVNISPVELLLGYPANFILTWKNRKNLNSKVYVPLCILVLAGSVFGALLLKNVNVRYLKVVFGVAVVFIGIEMLMREYQLLVIKDSKAFFWIVGILSGILCGLFGVGALLAAYVGRVTKTSDEFKANISAVFIVENTVRLVIYILLGVMTFASIKQALVLIPVVLLGLFAGMKSASLLNEKTVKKLVIVVLMILGVMLIVENIG
jgi:uncharacterized membrane protein YfcA